MDISIDRIILNTKIAAWLHRALIILSGLFITKLLIQTIGIDGYATFSIYISIFALILAVDFGASQTISRFIAKHAREDIFVKDLFPAIVVLLVGVQIVQVMILLLSGYVYQNLSPRVAIDLQLLYVVGSIVVLSFLFGINKSIFAGFQLYGLHGVGKIIGTSLYLLLFLGLYLLDKITIVNAVYAYAISKFVANFIMSIALVYVVGRNKFNVGDFDWNCIGRVKELTQYGLVSWLFGLSTVLYSTVSVLVVGALNNSDGVLALKIGLLLLSLLVAPITAILTPLTTIVSQFNRSSKQHKVLDAIVRLHTDVVTISMLSIVLYFYYGQVFVGYLVGFDKVDIGNYIYMLSTILVVPVVMSMPIFIYRYMLVNKKQNEKYSFFTLAAMVLATVCGSAGLYVFESVFPVVISISVALVFRSAFSYYMAFESEELLTVPLLTVFKHMVVVLLSGAMIVGLLDVLLKYYISDVSWVAGCVGVAMGLMYIFTQGRLRTVFAKGLILDGSKANRKVVAA